MQITEQKITVAQLCQGYRDNGDGDVFGFDGNIIRKKVGA